MKKKTKSSEDKTGKGIRPETRDGIIAISLFLISIILILSALDKAGVVGNYIFLFLNKLLGIGYYLLPVVCLMLGISFLRSFNARQFPILKTIGAIIFFFSGLGLIDIFSNGLQRGGIVGEYTALPFLKLFDSYASIIILGALLIASTLIIFEARLTLSPIIAFWNFIMTKLKRNKLEINLNDEEGGNNEEDYKEEVEPETKEIKKESKIIIKEPEENEINDAPFTGFRSFGRPYTPPPLTLLERDSGKPIAGDIKASANIIKRTLQNFGISVEMDEVSIGPSVTRYALKPAEGVKLSKIAALQDNLAYALAAHPIRIEAPIPGKSLVGIEVPNSTKSTVGLASMLGNDEYQQSDKPLLISLGKTISGKSQFGNLGKMPHLLIAGATGSGKTCGEDTYIFSEKGILTFKELCPLSLNSEISYLLKVATRDGTETTSKNYNNGICDFYKITTEEGLSIEVTDEHPLWTIKDGNMGWRQSGKIQTGEYVAISREPKLFGAKEQINFVPMLNKTNKARVIQTPTKMTRELGLLMGLLTADGGLTIGNRIVYTQANEEVLNIYTGLLKNLFDINATTITKSGASNKAKDVVINSKHLKDFLKHLDLKPVGAQEKEIPRSIRESKPEIIKSFIQGLIRNDGHISALKGLEITLATERLLRQLQIILLNFGIVSSIHRKKVKGYEQNNYWRLTIYGGEFVKYAQEIGFLTNEERAKTKLLLALHRNTNKNIIPTLSPIFKKLSLMYRETFARLTNKGWGYQQGSLVPKYAFNSLRSYNSGARNPSYEALEKILAFYEPVSDSDEYKKITEIQKENFYWAKVAIIEKTRGVGYDFEVPGSNSFVGNGFVNHNSVTIHTIINSLIFRNSPDNLKFIMIDPKRVELTLYNKIPHLLTPVITEAKKAILSLKWAAKEMDRRYEILEKNSVRDIDSYHKNILAPALKKINANNEEGEEKNAPDLMPYIIIVIDELADIMTSYPRELEAAIVRLAQMSRAVGIHLILSTQRPSVNVITGLIKANIPARIALQVSSQIDSRTILDAGGAEKLLGAGDMLYLGGDMSKPLRIQSAFLSEGEVKKVTKYLKDAYMDELPSEITLTGESITDNGPSIFDASFDDKEEEIDDDLYETAREEVIHAGKASTSYIQRKLRVGYSRAARLMDILEERGVIGPADGSKPREVLSPASEMGEIQNNEEPNETNT